MNEVNWHNVAELVSVQYIKELQECPQMGWLVALLVLVAIIQSFFVSSRNHYHGEVLTAQVGKLNMPSLEAVVGLSLLFLFLLLLFPGFCYVFMIF